ncbi:hypothetical protein K502DRAFT_289058 [Neoconidiobolus thromboides FSU 785]|nr:hypothetical protein K502DRAFT_289058 [Neoconidiobolus thromboides FSU 785]
MKILNKDAFKKVIKVLAVKIPPRTINIFLKEAANLRDLFNQPRFRNVLDLPQDKPNKLILFKIGTDLECLSEKTRSLIKEHGIESCEKEVEFTYEHWSADSVLRSILPDDLQVPSSFSTIGHIAHFNLREEFYPYKKLLGQVILEKNPNIRTVINKTDIIDAQFRNFQLELLAGEPNYEALVKECDCKFELDFSKVYWNPRLQTEHERIISQFKEGDIICDVMAGIGPFAIPACKKGQIVYCNDLNPVSYEYLIKNIKHNKLKIDENIFPFNLDGRDFIKKAFQLLYQKHESKSSGEEKIKIFDHAVMNLPATAIEFIDGFRGIFTTEQGKRLANLPIAHVHCFSKSLDDPLSDLLNRASNALGRIILKDEVLLHHVRKVAPNKDMYCLSINLTLDDLWYNL